MLRARLGDLWAAPLARAVVLGLGCLAGAEVGHALSLTTQGQALAAFWPPAGLVLAALALTPSGSWPLLLAAACAANLASDVLLHHHPLPVSLGFCAANAAEACVGALLLRRFVGRSLTLTRVEEVLGLALWPTLLSTALGATLGAGMVWLAFGVSYGPAWQVWWLGDALGVLVVTPVVLTWATERVTCPGLRPWRLAERAAVFLGMLVAAEGVYGGWLPRALTVPIFILPFLLWAGLRFGPRGAATAVLLVAVVGVWNTCRGRGPYALLTDDPWAQLLREQATLFVISLSVVGLAAVVAERKQAEQQRLRLSGALAEAVAEIKSLRGLIPICAWCRKLRDDQGAWQRLEDYLRTHTEATLTHGICPDCLQQQSAALGPGDHKS